MSSKCEEKTPGERLNGKPPVDSVRPSEGSANQTPRQLSRKQASNTVRRLMLFRRGPRSSSDTAPPGQDATERGSPSPANKSSTSSSNCQEHLKELSRVKLELETSQRQVKAKENRLLEALDLLKEKEAAIASFQRISADTEGQRLTTEGRGLTGECLSGRTCVAMETMVAHVEELEEQCRSQKEVSREMCSRNVLLEQKVVALSHALADKDGSLGELHEEAESRREQLARVCAENRSLVEQAGWAGRLRGENQALRGGREVVLGALAAKERVILDLLGRVEQLQEGGSEGEGPPASEDLRNENQRLEVLISLQENHLRMKELKIAECEECLKAEQDKLKGLLSSVEDRRAMLGSLDVRQAVLRAALSEKDARMADLEKKLGPSKKPGGGSSKKRQAAAAAAAEELAQLRVQRDSLKKDLKSLHHYSTTVRRFGRQESCSDLLRECQGASMDQILQEVHRLNSAGDRLKQFIDLFLTVILEKNPSLLQDMPQCLGQQHSTGLRPQLLATATKADLLEEVEEQESGCNELLMYTSALFERVVTRDSALLDSLRRRLTSHLR